ncbi:hypothetical protein FRC07_012872, partial [Ceratobasidium sp. 392]
ARQPCWTHSSTNAPTKLNPARPALAHNPSARYRGPEPRLEQIPSLGHCERERGQERESLGCTDGSCPGRAIGCGWG